MPHWRAGRRRPWHVRFGRAARRFKCNFRSRRSGGRSDQVGRFRHARCHQRAERQPGGGAPGDGTHLLRAMLAAGLAESTFGTLYDPEVADTAHRGGWARPLRVRLGGKHDRSTVIRWTSRST